MLQKLFLLVFTCFVSLQALAFAQDFSQTVAYIQSMQSSNGIPGLAYAITREREVVQLGTLGVRSIDSGEAVTPQTLFHIGSTHKGITALLIGRLAEAGVTRWGASVSELLGHENFSDPLVGNTNLSHLLSMTSGILDYSEDDFYDAYGDYPTPDNLMSFMLSYRLPQFPDKEFSYSNLSVSYAGYLVAQAFGTQGAGLNEKYAGLLQEWVLDPLGMTQSTIFYSQARASSDFSVSHTKSNGRAVVATTEDRDDDMFAPAGSLKTSITDMTRYIMTVANRGVSPDGTRIFKPRVIKALWRPTKVSKASGDNYGRGWERKTISGVRMMMHEGAFDNFTSVVAVVPKKKTGLVILVNTEYTSKLLSMAPQIFAQESAGQ
ncbi:MAG: beta-lactamase family protein [Bdellovibrionales bacterium]|nr:beta-lactamase family protein [Bdellovibrionales bacterium]